MDKVRVGANCPDLEPKSYVIVGRPAQSVETTVAALALVSLGDGMSLLPSWVTTLAWRSKKAPITKNVLPNTFSAI
jgi:hypothetical protein